MTPSVQRTRASGRGETDQQLLLDTVLNNMSQGVLMFDPETRMVFCNQRYIEMYGLSADVVQPGCTLLLTVPAYRWAWSDHDVTLGHHRRYTARALRRRVAAAGFTIRRCTYFHSWLVPLAFLVRKTPLGRLMRGSAEGASFVGPGVNRLLHLVSRAERGVIRILPLPFGLSIMLVAERPTARSRGSGSLR